MFDWILRRFRPRPSSVALRPLRMSDLDDLDFVRVAYLVILRRDVDDVGLACWREIIERKTFSHDSVVNGLLASEEYQRQFGPHVNERLHAARCAWVKTLPAFERLLDIGGSSRTFAEGALIQMGYPHRPRELHILDLPPDRQNWSAPEFDQSVPSRFEWGTVTYYHGSAESIAGVAALQEHTYDGVFLGQAVEHIDPRALPGILDWIREHLAPDGELVMDTPNRILTRIQCPTWYIHPDHKLEYEPSQLVEQLRAHGFRVVEKIGLVHLPGIAGSGVYDAREFGNAELIHADADSSYLFALHAVRA